MGEVSNYDDVIDSRDVIEQIAELESIQSEEGSLTEDAQHELDTLRDLAKEAAAYAADWQHGATLIRDSYFTEYAQQLADDIGAISAVATWPACHIDWKAAADALRQDYTSVEFDGVTYWTR